MIDAKAQLGQLFEAHEHRDEKYRTMLPKTDETFAT